MSFYKIKNLFLVLISFNAVSNNINIGPVEFKEDVKDICTTQCKKNNASWTGKLTCNYQNLTKQNMCDCSCK